MELIRDFIGLSCFWSK